MAKIVPLSVEERAASGYTHVINVNVFTEITAPAAVVNITAVAPGIVCTKAAMDVKTAVTGMTSPTIGVAFANTGTAGTNILNAAAAATLGTTVVANPTAVVTAASQFITVTNTGTTTPATAGEVNIYVALWNSLAGRNTFA